MANEKENTKKATKKSTGKMTGEHTCKCSGDGCCHGATNSSFKDRVDRVMHEFWDIVNDPEFDIDYCLKTATDVQSANSKEKNLKKDILQDLFQACPDIDSSEDNSLKDLVDEWKSIQTSTEPAGVKEKRENNKFSSFKKDIMKLADTYPKMFHDFIQTVSLSGAFDNTMLDEDDDELFDDSRTLIGEIRFPINLSTHDTHIQIAPTCEANGNSIILEFEFFTEKPNSYNRLTRYKSYNIDQCADELFDDLTEFLKEHLSVYCNPFV